MRGNVIFGKLNENLQIVMNELIKSDNLTKFLWYRDTDKNIPSLKELTNKQKLSLIRGDNRKIFPRVKIPSVDSVARSYVCIRYTNILPSRRNSKNLSRQVLKFYIICHESLCDTLNGQRDICIAESIRQIFDNRNIVGIGRTTVPTITDVQVAKGYMGYEMQYEILDFEE